MAPEPLVFLLLVIFGFASTCTATTHTVGDNSGWDISTDLDSWTKGKKFYVGDVLLFQYSSSSHSVSEVTRENYQGCNTTNVLQSSSNGNTSFALTQPGYRYFICGNQLHCYGGMKLQVLTQEAQATAASPAGAPQPESGVGSSSLPQPSSKNNNPSTVTPNSATFYRVGIFDSLSIAFLCAIASTLPWSL